MAATHNRYPAQRWSSCRPLHSSCCRTHSGGRESCSLILSHLPVGRSAAQNSVADGCTSFPFEQLLLRLVSPLPFCSSPRPLLILSPRPPAGPPPSCLSWSSTTAGNLCVLSIHFPTSLQPRRLTSALLPQVAGFSPDFATTNPIGYFSLSVFNLALFFSAKVRSQYAGRHHGGRPAVSGADVAFAIYVRFMLVFDEEKFRG